MGVPTERQMERLTDVALDAMEAEVAAWSRIGTWSPRTVRLVRHPRLSIADIGPSDVPTVEDSYQHIELPDEQVNDFLRRAAVQAALKAVFSEPMPVQTNITVEVV